MSEKQKASVLQKSAEKKAALLETRRKNRLPLVAACSLAALIAALTVFFITRDKPLETATAAPSKAEIPTTSIVHPVDLFEDGKARHFQYRSDDGITIRYFILKSSDGVIRAAFDACDVCWPAGKGYEQSGDSMVCRNCGRRFASVLVNEVKGGCNPAPLKRALRNGRVVVEVDDLLSGKQYFDFSKRG